MGGDRSAARARARLAWVAVVVAVAVASALAGTAPGARTAPAARAATTSLTPVADAYVDGSATTTRYGTTTRLAADASPTRISYLRFDLTGVAGPITEARLRLHVADATDAPSPSGGTVARVTDTGWSEATITYATRPTSFGSTVATIGAVTRNTWIEVPVTAAVTAGGTVTLGVRSSNTDGALYDSRERGANAPRLVVVTSDGTPPPATAAAAACSGQLVSTNAGTVQGTALKEISGFDAGVVNPDVLWTHNDSGDTARVFAMTTAGATRATYTLTGASAVDWEDIAVGPGPVAGRSYLYVADIGDNARARTEVVLYRVAEPTVPASGGTIALAGVEAIRLRYPDGAHNAEALIVDPLTGDLLIVEKTTSGGTARIYRAPGSTPAATLTTMTQVGTLALPAGSTNLVTGADTSADGLQLALRTYAGVLLWTRAAGSSVAATLAGTACQGQLPVEVQGEAIAFAPDGKSYLTVSEGTGQVIHRFSTPG